MARRFYWMLQPQRVWRYIVYWGFSIPSRLNVPLEDGQHIWASCLVGGRHVSHTMLNLVSGQALLHKQNYPLVSCMLVTRKRFLLARQSIQCFLQQTYPNKELIVIDDEKDSELQAWVAKHRNPAIQYLHLADEGKTLGALRNLAVEHAQGEYVVQWDDDDLNHPQRLMWQLAAMFAADVQVSFLHRQMLWSPQHIFLGVSHHFMAENTMLCKKSLLPAYPDIRKGEDTPVCEQLVQKHKVLLCDCPQAYIYSFQGESTWGEEHFHQLAEQCSQQYKGDAYTRKLTELSQNYGVNMVKLMSPRTGPAKQTPRVEKEKKTQPTMLVLVPVKNAEHCIARFIKNLAATDYPAEKISLAFLEGDSSDDSYAKLEAALIELREKYARVELYQKHYRYRLTQGQQRWAVSEQRQRRAILARSRNTLLSRALRDETWVMWIDVDVASWPADAFVRLLETSKDIVAPHCVTEDGDTFDLNTFKLHDDADALDWERYVVDGILQPPVGYGRHYLGAFAPDELVELDGVGGTMLLVRADIHREGLNFPVQPHRYYIETEGLAQIAMDMGYQSWGMPGLEIVHERS